MIKVLIFHLSPIRYRSIEKRHQKRRYHTKTITPISAIYHDRHPPLGQTILKWIFTCGPSTEKLRCVKAARSTMCKISNSATAVLTMIQETYQCMRQTNVTEIFKLPPELRHSSRTLRLIGLTLTLNKKLSCRRDRTTFRVTEYFAKSLKITQGHSYDTVVSSRACVSPYQYSIETMYLVPFLRYSASKNGVTLKPGVGFFKVIENGAVRQTIYTTFYWSAVVNIALSGTVFELLDVD